MLTQMLTDDQRRALDDLGASRRRSKSLESRRAIHRHRGARRRRRVGGSRRRKEPEAIAVTEPSETAQVDADVQPAESFDLPLAAEASPLPEEVWEIEPIADSESLEVASAPLPVEPPVPAAISEHALAERVAALEREAAETLAAEKPNSRRRQRRHSRRGARSSRRARRARLLKRKPHSPRTWTRSSRRSRPSWSTGWKRPSQRSPPSWRSRLNPRSPHGRPHCRRSSSPRSPTADRVADAARVHVRRTSG